MQTEVNNSEKVHFLSKEPPLAVDWLQAWIITMWKFKTPKIFLYIAASSVAVSSW